MKTSVALCTYNGEKYIKEQLDSILNQTKKVDEIIVCDDCSSDKTVEILNHYSSTNPGLFKIYINEQNLRSVKNFEKAITLCTGDIIFLSDQDDFWVNEKVEIYVKYFEQNPKIEVIASNSNCIDKNSVKISSKTVWDIALQSKKTYLETIILHQNFATGATMALKKVFFYKNCLFPKEIHHDEWLVLLASNEKKFMFLNEKLTNYRIHADQLVGSVMLSNKSFEKKLLKINSKIENQSDKQIFSNMKKWKRNFE
ncbi:glycosyltransferase, partial [Flavobacterium psychrophilum]|nr:glycosyltransferase [Flavobacterium psychrophilum]